MWNEPGPEQLSKITRLYETDGVTAMDNKLIYLHFFIGGCDWYIAEYDGEDMFFGFAILNNDLDNAEWGYVSFQELKETVVHGWMEIDHDLHWQVTPAGEIPRIMKTRIMQLIYAKDEQKQSA